MAPAADDDDSPRSAAAAVARTLRDRAVDAVFCLPGEETIALLEAIGEEGIDLVVARHEQHAAFMAATHGRLTGRPGVLVTTLGPGMTNALTGLAHATLGGYPLLHIAGQKPLRDNDEGSFQVLDLVALAAPVTKWAQRCTDPQEAATLVDTALRVAVTDRPGAVFVELPQDVATGVSTLVPPPPTPSTGGGVGVPLRAPSAEVDRAAALLRAASRPAVVIGGGAQRSDVGAALASFAEASLIPVIPLQTGIGALSADVALPAIGMHRPDAAHLPLVDADLVLTVGYHPTEHPPLAWNRSDAPIVHVAAWPAPERRGLRHVAQLVGDVADTLTALAACDLGTRPDRRATLRDAIDAQLASEPLHGDGPGVATRVIVDAVGEVLAADDVVALDNGSYKLWFARHLRVRRRNGLLLDNALATMGAGLATASEAARQEPDVDVMAVVGDGGFMMNVGDVETAVRLGLDNLTVLVVRDDTFGFIADHQRERDRSRVAVDLGNPDIVGVAEAFGATGMRVGGPGDVVAVLRAAVDRRGVVIVDCPLDERADDLLREIDSLAGARTRLAAAER
ncbi:MAG: acetolactate synthase large subunit [Ilumatobacter sp.]|nr:acetolactate synthase large subunit [Ilumatobacter sp.]